jgi:hypothetical protein
MTPLHIHRTSRPISGYAPVQPMTQADAEFWRLLRMTKPPSRGGWLRRLFRKD